MGIELEKTAVEAIRDALVGLRQEVTKAKEAKEAAEKTAKEAQAPSEKVAENAQSLADRMVAASLVSREGRDKVAKNLQDPVKLGAYLDKAIDLLSAKGEKKASADVEASIGKPVDRYRAPPTSKDRLKEAGDRFAEALSS